MGRPFTWNSPLSVQFMMGAISVNKIFPRGQNFVKESHYQMHAADGCRRSVGRDLVFCRQFVSYVTWS
jgi:hypothetical protein